MISNRDRLAGALLSSVAEHDWLTKAACTPENSETWWPLPGSRGTDAATICHTQCPVRLQCLKWAVANHETAGIWGGLTPTERDQWARANNIQPERPAADPDLPAAVVHQARALRAMRRAGWSVRQIADYHRVTVRTVNGWFQQLERLGVS